MLQPGDPSEQSTVELRVGRTQTQARFEDLQTSATGFFVKHSGNDYLVTNLHVVTGQNPEVSRHKEDIDQPQYLLINQWLINRVDFLPLFRDGRPVWYESSEVMNFEGKDFRTDVAVIPVPHEMAVAPLNLKLGLYERQTPFRAQDCVVIGYPFHRTRPIWKTAHIAETVQPGPDYFLVNGRTKPGMSGSPVFNVFFAGKDTYLSGVYSGRYDDTGMMDILNDLDIGIVWKIRVVERLIAEAATVSDF